MAKKTVVEEEVSVTETIEPLMADFGREDLNALRDLVNKLVSRLK